jgi:DNA-binding GntR family transcriptional regulator
MMDAVPRELIEARLTVEPQVARICAGNVGPPEVRRLRGLIAECEAEGERAPVDELGHFLALSHDFHSELAKSCGNSILADLTRQLVDVAAHPLWQLVNAMHVRVPGHRAEQVAEHRAILDAVERADGEAAATLMHDHLAGLENSIFGTVRVGTGIVRQPPRSR